MSMFNRRTTGAILGAAGIICGERSAGDGVPASARVRSASSETCVSTPLVWHGYYDMTSRMFI